jgi:hypothetical protein
MADVSRRCTWVYERPKKKGAHIGGTEFLENRINIQKKFERAPASFFPQNSFSHFHVSPNVGSEEERERRQLDDKGDGRIIQKRIRRPKQIEYCFVGSPVRRGAPE